MNNFDLSILEFGTLLAPNILPHNVINSLFEEISIYEKIGYRRLWLSEHYSREFAWFNPEMLIPLLAGYSDKIKVGIAGILLNYHSPLRVAQNFKMLSSIYPNRIDLGLARAFVPDNTSIYLISQEEVAQKKDYWEQKVSQLTSFVREIDPAKSLIKDILVPPHGTILPELWILGSSGSSINIAIKEKTNFCLSFMHPGSNYNKNKDLIKFFKEEYYIKHLEVPTSSVLICCQVLKDEKIIKKYNNQYNINGNVNLFGGIDYIKEKLNELHSQFGNDEFAIFCPAIDREERIFNYQSFIN